MSPTYTPNNTTITALNANTSSLLLLPTELRLQIYLNIFKNQIYKLTTKNHPIEPNILPRFAIHPQPPSLPAVCRQIRSETASLAESEATFYIGTQTHWEIWLKLFSRMPQPMRKLRLGFGMYWSVPPRSAYCGVVGAVPDLQELEIAFFRIDFDGGGTEEEEWEGYAEARRGIEEWLLRGYMDGQVVVV
jgi:hypothetical protein